MDHKKHEIISLCILIITLLVLFSLLSFHQADQTLFFQASTVKRAPSNWVGSLGANLSYPLLFLFGIGAYGIPLTGFWLSWSLFRGSPALSFKRIQAVGFALLLLSFISLVAIHQSEMRLMSQKIQAGGKIGYLISEFLVRRIYLTGSYILLVGTGLIALVLATPFSVKTSCLWLGSCALWCGKGAMGILSGLWRLIWKRRSAAVDESAQDQPLLPALATDLDQLRASRQNQAEQEAIDLAAPPQIEIIPPMALPAPKGRKKARKGAEAALAVEEPDLAPGQYSTPSNELLDMYEAKAQNLDWKKLEENARVLEEKLSDFGVLGKVVAISPGPVITMYEYAPAPGIKISRIVGLSDDLSMALKAMSIRVVAPIPGKAVIGIEIPNQQRQLVSIRAVLESEAFSAAPQALTIALGEDITGHPVVANLAKMPHLLIAGATGTGKSVCINTLLTSLLFRNTPEELRLLLIDPKRIELSTYEGIPHLIHPVVTDAKMATRALNWAVQEMELRYMLLAEKNVRNIEGYNRALAKEKPKAAEATPEDGEVEGSGLEHHHLPYIVIIIDELADLMMVASKEVEESITRLAQMARAAGIHLILATQRPSVDVLTGIIKANIPTRISFQVSSRIDSRTILDGSGAENLLGSGDMLFLPPGTAKIQRIHGAYISDGEVQRVTGYWQAQQLADDPIRNRVNFQDQSSSSDLDEEEADEKYEEAIELVLETRQASISMLQRRLRVGYNRAARMIERMERQGIVSASDGVKPREVLGRRN